jgi:hypothetical protein
LTPEERIELLETQFAYFYEAFKLVLQGKWTGEMPTAEAFIKAIRSDEADGWSAVEFPKE